MFRAEGRYKGKPVVIFIDEEFKHLLVKPHVVKQKNNGKLRVYVKPSGHFELLHRLIMNAPRGVLIDHIDQNPLNNQRANLRFATQSQNNCNRTKTLANSTGYKGVWKRNDGRKKCWVAEIKFEGKHLRLGSFYSAAEAALAYNTAALALHGEFACLNSIKETEGYHV